MLRWLRCHLSTLPRSYRQSWKIRKSHHFIHRVWFCIPQKVVLEICLCNFFYFNWFKHWDSWFTPTLTGSIEKAKRTDGLRIWFLANLIWNLTWYFLSAFCPSFIHQSVCKIFTFSYGFSSSFKWRFTFFSKVR